MTSCRNVPRGVKAFVSKKKKKKRDVYVMYINEMSKHINDFNLAKKFIFRLGIVRKRVKYFCKFRI